MAAPLNVGLPPDLDLGGGYSVEFTALDPSTGADVAAVKVSLATLTVDNVSGDSGQVVLPVGPFQLIPLDDLNTG